MERELCGYENKRVGFAEGVNFKLWGSEKA
jgi:hypothetical protein